MIFSLTWLPEVLEQAGLKVAETEGWRSHGRGPMGVVRGVICHHTATAAPGNMPSLSLLKRGRSDLTGPLAHLGLGRDGTFYIIAAGRANHAGTGVWEGLRTGNSSFIGIEAENDGIHESWPEVQIDAYQRGVAAILVKIGAGANMCAGHREYAPKRKTDPDFDMIAFRRGVAEFLQGKSPRAPIASADAAGTPTLRRGASSPDVARAQILIGIADADGKFGSATEAAVREFQREHGLVPDGIIGPASWKVLESQPDAKDAPADAPDPTAGPTAVQPAAPEPAPAAALSPPVADTPDRPPHSDGRLAYNPDGKAFATCAEPGFRQWGTTTIARWLQSLDQAPPVSPSTIRVLKAMSGNEGQFEAINSYDSAFLSCGILQWTAGEGRDPGELAYLLSVIKKDDPDTFAECFGQYGLDVSVAGFTGRLSLKGRELLTPGDKEELRDLTWAYRFWRASHFPSVRLAQFQVAASRIGRFRGAEVAGHPLSVWMSSERAIAHLLDEHVNRPGHVPKTLDQAVRQLYGQAVPDPATLDEATETRLLHAYLNIRAIQVKGAMTASNDRAARIDQSVTRGTLSQMRDSYRP